MTKGKGGRPPIEIDWRAIDAQLAIQATLTEIAAAAQCSEDTIERACVRDKGMSFAEYRDLKKSRGLMSLRRKQFQLALEGDRVMLIWLGKQYLNQTEPVTLQGKDGGPIKTQDVPASDAERADKVDALMRRAEMRRRGAS